MHSLRLLWVLGFLCLGSALAVVYVSYQGRAAFIIWQDLLDVSYRLDVEWGQLMLEKNTLASYARLQSIAEERLDMIEPSQETIEVIQKVP